MHHSHLLTILYVNQQGPQNLGQLNKKGNGSSPDPFLAHLRRALKVDCNDKSHVLFISYMCLFNHAMHKTTFL